MKLVSKLLLLIALISFSSCLNSDEFLTDINDNPYDGGGTDPIANNAQLEADFAGAHFTALQGGVLGDRSIVSSGFAQLIALQIVGINQSNSVMIQMDGSSLHQGAVLNAANGDLARLNVMSLVNQQDVFDSIDFNGTADEDIVITITQFDSENNLVSGTFSGTLYNAFTGESMSLTNGTFTNVAFTNSSLSGMSYIGTVNLTQSNTDYSMGINLENESLASLFYFNTAQESSYTINATQFSTDTSELKTWALNFPYDATGTMNIDGVNSNLAYGYVDNNGNSENFDTSSSGTITITQNNSSGISGTFEGNAVNAFGESVTITNGTFNFQY